MKYSIACLLVAVSIATPVFADPVKIPEDKPVAAIMNSIVDAGK